MPRCGGSSAWRQTIAAGARRRRDGWRRASLPAAAARAAATAAGAAAVAATAAGGLGLLDHDRPAVEVRAVQAADRLLGLLGRRHLNEPEAARPAGLPIRHDARGLDGAGAGKGFAQALTGGRKRKAADEELDRHAKSSILGRTVHSEPTIALDVVEYTLS